MTGAPGSIRGRAAALSRGQRWRRQDRARESVRRATKKPVPRAETSLPPDRRSAAPSPARGDRAQMQPSESRPPRLHWPGPASRRMATRARVTSASATLQRGGVARRACCPAHQLLHSLNWCRRSRVQRRRYMRSRRVPADQVAASAPAMPVRRPACRRTRPSAMHSSWCLDRH